MVVALVGTVEVEAVGAAEEAGAGVVASLPGSVVRTSISGPSSTTCGTVTGGSVVVVVVVVVVVLVVVEAVVVVGGVVVVVVVV